MIGLYREGRSVLHRVPAGAKLAGLLLTGLVSPFVRSPEVTAAGLVLVLAGYALARMPVRVLLQMLRPLLIVMVPLGIFQTVVAGWERAFVIVGVLVALVLLANLVTLTTRTSDLVDVVVRVCGPLRRVGVNPERVGLMLQLAIRAVPLIIDLGRRVREAQHARGLGASPRAFAVPLIVGALRRADAMGDALAARGFDD
ncbi:cobalt ABC transporter [Janibacter sp. Soil728]|uniref:energy-coupling factor transporter transmembrane component T family protein n=1 Tax=Janibacter sp. Soil728 TaxID=1736393 RepID=UPI0006F83B29|nr:energy-coupling factor transporter transmembrane protein EcfT [Janibacter sp. Soil728]KRE37709.1 cobalt ABC transporter [Janibacter sp. Soil728]